MSAQAAVPMNIRRPLVGPSIGISASLSHAAAAQAASEPALEAASVQSERTDAHGQANNMPNSDAVIPVDAARTVSDAAHSASLIAAEIERPAVVPRNDSRHPP